MTTTWYTIDEFGNQWRCVKLQSGTTFCSPAPTQNLEDFRHDEWGSWKWIWWYKPAPTIQ